MIYSIATLGIIILLAVIFFFIYRNEKCHHEWIKKKSTYSEKEYTFHYECKKCKEPRSETYIIF